jgi:hypothetical protein
LGADDSVFLNGADGDDDSFELVFGTQILNIDPLRELRFAPESFLTGGLVTGQTRIHESQALRHATKSSRFYAEAAGSRGLVWLRLGTAGRNPAAVRDG